MRPVRPHIQIDRNEEGRVFLAIGDDELFDFVSDYLGDECDLPYEYRTSTTRPGGEVMTMYFPLGVTATELEECLCRLSPEEIERIYRLDIPAGGGLEFDRDPHKK